MSRAGRSGVQASGRLGRPGGRRRRPARCVRSRRCIEEDAPGRLNAPVADNSLIRYRRPGGSAINVLSLLATSRHCATGGTCNTAGTYRRIGLDISAVPKGSTARSRRSGAAVLTVAYEVAEPTELTRSRSTNSSSFPARWTRRMAGSSRRALSSAAGGVICRPGKAELTSRRTSSNGVPIAASVRRTDCQSCASRPSWTRPTASRAPVGRVHSLGEQVQDLSYY